MQAKDRLVDGQIIVGVVTGDVQSVDDRACLVPITSDDTFLAINFDDPDVPRSRCCPTPKRPGSVERAFP